MDKNTLPVTEIFKSLSGEGAEIGTPTVFVRVFGCNMKPVCPWCDSMYSVEKQDDTIQRLTVEEIVNTIRSFNCKDITFTGGEPMLYEDQIKEVMNLLLASDTYKFHFETNGMLHPDYRGYDITYAISPKLHAMDLTNNDRKHCGSYIGKLRRWVQIEQSPRSFKFVYENKDSIGQIKKLEYLMMGFGKCDVYLMPEGNAVNEQKYLECAKECIKLGYKFSPRLQNILWGPKRGV